MPYELVRNDITLMKVDAIVNAANETLLGGGGVDGAIHRAAGPELREECRKLNGCKTGEAKITGAYRLPCRYVIHTVGPVWEGGAYGEAEMLSACYRNSLELAKEYGCKTVAFPLISAGAYGYPKDRALKIALDTIGDFLFENDMLVYLVLFGRTTLDFCQRLNTNIAHYIDDNYAREHLEERSVLNERRRVARRQAEAVRAAGIMAESCCEASVSLEEQLESLDESFSQMLLRKIDEKGMKDAECYKRANIDRKLFSKIRGDVHYRPSKRTAVALAIALELPRAEFDDMLNKAGYALTRASRFDVIIQYYIEQGNYDINAINISLFDYDEQLLGA